MIDGVTIEFQLAPGTEAPAEMHFFFPSGRALNLAENTNHTMHNLCPRRGSQVRDALAWSKHLHAALHRWGDQIDVLFAQHHWPTWGQAKVRRGASLATRLRMKHPIWRGYALPGQDLDFVGFRSCGF